jgi:hypothetical protein
MAMVKAIRQLNANAELGNQIANSSLCEGGLKKNWTTLVYQCELITPMFGPSGVSIGQTRP